MTLISLPAALAERGLDPQFAELSARAEASHTEAIYQKELLAKRQIEYGNAQLKADIATVPRYFYTSTGKRYENPDYSFTVQSLRDSFQARVSSINQQLDRDLAQLQSFYERRQADLQDSRDNLRSQIVSSQGSIQVTSNGTGMYVRNYINYGGVANQPSYSQPISAVQRLSPELRATAGRLK